MGLKYEVKVIGSSENQGVGQQNIRTSEESKIISLIPRFPDGHHLIT